MRTTSITTGGPPLREPGYSARFFACRQQQPAADPHDHQSRPTTSSHRSRRASFTARLSGMPGSGLSPTSWSPGTACRGVRRLGQVRGDPSGGQFLDHLAPPGAAIQREMRVVWPANRGQPGHRPHAPGRPYDRGPGHSPRVAAPVALPPTPPFTAPTSIMQLTAVERPEFRAHLGLCGQPSRVACCCGGGSGAWLDWRGGP